MKEISLTKILKTDNISNNPRINFVTDVYDPDFPIVSNGRKVKLEDTIESDLFLVTTSSKKAYYGLLFRNVIAILFVSFFFSLFGTVITFGTNFLPKEPHYWKYMVLEFSILSLSLFGFSDFFTILFEKNPWARRCAANSKVFNGDNIYKCSPQIAIRDVQQILKRQTISYKDEKYFPYGDDYYERIINELEKLDTNCSLENKYAELLSKIGGRPSLLRVISSFMISASIQAFTFIDTFNELKNFLNNIIIVAIIVPFVSFFLARAIISHRYLSTYIKLDSLLFLYSYLCLEMPIGESFPSLEKELDVGEEECDDFELEGLVQEESKRINDYISFRNAKIENGKLKYYIKHYYLHK